MSTDLALKVCLVTESKLCEMHGKLIMVDQKIMAIAYHEAGHTVMAKLNRIRLKSISIVPDEKSLGRVIHAPIWNGTTPDYDVSRESEMKMQRRVKTLFAGRLAEQLYEEQKGLTHQNLDSDTQDNEQALQFVSYFCGTDDEVDAYLKLLHIRTRNEITEEYTWNALEKLAQRLFKKKTISANQAYNWFKQNFPLLCPL